MNEGEAAANPTPSIQTGRPQRSAFPGRIVLSLGALAVSGATAIVMLYFPPSGTQKLRSGQNTTPAALDIVALAHSVTMQCAMGLTDDKKAEVSANLQTFFSGIKAGAQVTTSQVGKISEKVVATEQGTLLYKAYVECLKMQTSLSLAQSGVNVVVPDPAEIERQKDENVRQAISDINPETPQEKLIEIFGQPTSSSKVDGPGNMTLQIYRYKYAAFAYDYRSGQARVGIVLATKDPMQGESMLFNQIANVNIGTAYDTCDGIVMSAHQNARSRVCPASHATGYLAQIYFFPVARIMGLRKEVKSPACQAVMVPDWKKCPGFASAPALAVALVSNPTQSAAIDKRLVRVAEAYTDYLDFGGGGVSLRSPKEQKDFEKRLDDQMNFTATQSDAEEDKEAEERSLRYKALLQWN